MEIANIMKAKQLITGNAQRSAVIYNKAKLGIKAKRLDMVGSNVARFIARCFATMSAIHASKAITLKDGRSPLFILCTSTDFVVLISDSTFPQRVFISLRSVSFGAFSTVFRCISRTLSAAVETSRQPAFPPRMILGRTNLELFSIWNPALSYGLQSSVPACYSSFLRQIRSDLLSTGTAPPTPDPKRIWSALSNRPTVFASGTNKLHSQFSVLVGFLPTALAATRLQIVATSFVIREKLSCGWQPFLAVIALFFNRLQVLRHDCILPFSRT
jgi:hypothetical protein